MSHASKPPRAPSARRRPHRGLPAEGGVRRGVRADGPRLRRPAGRRRDVSCAAGRVGVVGRAARRARVGRVRHGGPRRLPCCSARGPVEPRAGDRPHGHGLEPRRGGGRSGPEFRPTAHRARRPRRRRGGLRPGRRGAPGNQVPTGPPGDGPRSVPGGGAAGCDAGGAPRRHDRGALGMARGVLGIRAPGAGRGVAVPPGPGLSDGAAGRRDRCPRGGGRTEGAVPGPVRFSGVHRQRCPAGGRLDALHVAAQPAAPRVRPAGRPGGGGHRTGHPRRVRRHDRVRPPRGPRHCAKPAGSAPGTRRCWRCSPPACSPPRSPP